MRSDNGMIGAAVLWLLVALGALGLAGLKLARWQKNRATSALADVQARLLIAASSQLAQQAQFQFIEKNDMFETGTVQLIKLPGADPTRVTLNCVAKVGSFEKDLDISWKKIPNGWALAYWAEP